MINELYSSRRASNLEEILDSDANPSKEEVLNSKDFQVNLINDLVGKKNIDSWTVHKSSGSIDDLESENDKKFRVDYDFDFKYNFHGIKVPLTLFINGEVEVDHKPTKSWTPREYSKPSIDYNTLGNHVDLALYDDDGSEISLTWLTPELKAKVVKSIISPYL